MDLLRAIELRHSVRKFHDRPLDPDASGRLKSKAEELNRQYGLHIQLVTNEPRAFRGYKSFLAGFANANNYLAMVGPKSTETGEQIGYAGEQMVLLAQQLGLNTCWAATTYRKTEQAFSCGSNEKLWILIAVGYGMSQGNPHSSKPFEKISITPEEQAPDWYLEGVRAALLAPTAMNQQKFHLELVGKNKVRLTPSSSILGDLDLGIVRLHFEIGAGTANFSWV